MDQKTREEIEDLREPLAPLNLSDEELERRVEKAAKSLREARDRERLIEELASSMTDCGDYWHVPHDVGQRFVDAILYDRT